MKDHQEAALWWRISTDDQREISPETQVSEARSLAEHEGFAVPEAYVLGTDWHSLSVWESPPMERLKELIRSGAITALFMYDADRGPSKPVHRLLLRALCEEHCVAIRCVHGQVPDGDMGEVMEFLSAWAKEKQVHRAQQGSSDGLRDRVRIKKLPASNKAPYGYRWDGTHFAPSDTYSIAAGIWDMLKQGKPDRQIAGVLTRAGIPTPSGRQVWSASTICEISTNPAYCGHYTGLRTKKIEPQHRYKPTYGKTGTTSRPVEEQVVLEDLIIRPIVTPEEFASVQERRALNKAFGGKQVVQYLLRGMVVCCVCGRRFTGVSANGTHRRYTYYRCSRRHPAVGAPRCSNPPVSAPQLEAAVWDRVRRFLETPDVFFTEMEQQGTQHQGTLDSIQQAITRLEHQVQRYRGYKQRAFDEFVKGNADEETYQRTIAEYRAHVVWLEEERARQLADLEKAETLLLNIGAVKALYPRLREKLESATWDDKRFVLECLQARVAVEHQHATLELAVPDQVFGTVPTTPRGGCARR
ncbi:MAG: recombinase family protein [Chloroflexi bacterium]|nr:recombinase family protein [Chloroflexota bacterium]